MLAFNVTDRRSNSGKNLNNRQRFMERVKKKIEHSVNKGLGNRGIADEGEAEVSISRDGIDEPQFQYDRKKGVWDHLLPGNKHYNVGDGIPRPRGGDGGGGSEGSPDGEGEDDFRFYVSYDEYINAIFGDLSLPDMVKESEKHTTNYKVSRAGYTTVGAASNLALERTMVQSIARRFALKTPKLLHIKELEEELEDADDERKIALEEEIVELLGRANSVPFLDKSDLRYRATIRTPQPVSKAVMFCVDGETEYLTRSGWKPIRDYQDGEIAQYCTDGSIEFVSPTFVKNDYDGEFITIDAQGIDQWVTPEHRVVYRATDGKLKEWRAEALEAHHNALAHGFKGRYITAFNYGGDGLALSDDEIRMHIAFKADGTYQREHTIRAQFGFAKQRKIDRLKMILESMDIDYNLTDFERGTTNIYFSTTAGRIDKRFGPEWYNANREQLEIISEEVLLWDGYAERGNFCSEYKSDADYVQFVWAALGYGTSIYFSNGTWHATRCSYAERSIAGGGSNEPKKFTRQKSDDKHSYCFMVPSTMLLLRRNGNIFVTGNCLMDVSGSMTEHMKDLAKRFYILLYIFLKRQYKDVEVVFIRHTHEASEVDEDTFFHSPDTGGTVVSTAYDEMARVITARYPIRDWNIYCAQASDGDNMSSDTPIARDKLIAMMPWLQYYTYVEVGRDQQDFPPGFVRRDSEVWSMMEEMLKTYSHKMATRKINSKNEIVEVFRSLFKKRQEVQ